MDLSRRQSHSLRRPSRTLHQQVCDRLIFRKMNESVWIDTEQQSLGREESWEQVKVMSAPAEHVSIIADKLQSHSDADDAISIPGSSFSFDSKILQALF